MFSDTHFHFHHLVDERGLDGKEILSALVQRNTFFGLDIGTACDDLERRYQALEALINTLPEEDCSRARKMIFYSAGIWPDVVEIKDRFNAIKTLRTQIKNFPEPERLVAIGEGGLDHHWNPSGVDGRCESDFDSELYKGERELFELQLELARELKLPFIVHSRDAYEDTIDCIKNTGYNTGIIHCYSYGIDEARAFLDLGWYIAFGGAVTYTKKSKMDAMQELLRFVPEDRILLETDAPYLAPVPFRGQTNTPVLIEETYKFIAQIRGTSPEELSRIVDANIHSLFGV